MNKNLEGRTLRDSILNKLKKYISEQKLDISFTIISVGDNEASKIYIAQKEKAALNIGIRCEVLSFTDNIQTSELEEVIRKLNSDESVNGIIVQLPLSSHLDKQQILNTIDYRKDIDGLTNINLGKLLNEEKGIFPATAVGVIKLLEYYNIPIKSKDILVINRSTLVGKPLSLMLVDKGATVTIAHSETKKLNTILKNFDIIISAVGKKDLIKEEFVDERTILIDIGVDRVDGKIYGDFEEKLKQRNISTPSIGGIGAMTIAIIMKNIVDAYILQKDINGLKD